MGAAGAAGELVEGTAGGKERQLGGRIPAEEMKQAPGRVPSQRGAVRWSYTTRRGENERSNGAPASELMCGWVTQEGTRKKGVKEREGRVGGEGAVKELEVRQQQRCRCTHQGET